MDEFVSSIFYCPKSKNIYCNSINILYLPFNLKLQLCQKAIASYFTC